MIRQSTTVLDWLKYASKSLKSVNIKSSQLDAELILQDTLSVAKTFLRAHPEYIIPEYFLPILNARLSLRMDYVPIAYILKYKEFYGRKFKVTPATLIPRPESEDIINAIKILNKDTVSKSAIDIGTGSGILGITTSLECPNIKVDLSDISPEALNIASINASNLKAKVNINKPFSLLSETNKKFDYIIANLPYVDKSWQDTSPELRHEPALALYADKSGLELIFKLIRQSPSHLNRDGLIFLEADPIQHDAIIKYANQYSFTKILQINYCLVIRLKSK